MTTARILQPATWDPSEKRTGGRWPVQSRAQDAAIFEVRGVHFRSFTPKSAMEAAQINIEVNDIVRRAKIPGI